MDSKSNREVVLQAYAALNAGDAAGYFVPPSIPAYPLPSIPPATGARHPGQA